MSSLVHSLTCCLLSAKPSPETMLKTHAYDFHYKDKPVVILKRVPVHVPIYCGENVNICLCFLTKTVSMHMHMIQRVIEPALACEQTLFVHT